MQTQTDKSAIKSDEIKQASSLSFSMVDIKIRATKE